MARWPGHLSRRLCEGADGTWTEFLEWESRAAAMAAAEGFMADPTAQALMALIDPASVVMRHAPIVMAQG